MNLNDPNLDELLRQSLLDLDENNPDHQQLIDEVAQDVFSREWPAPSNKEKEAQLIGTARKFSLPKWTWILSSLFLATGSIALYMFVNAGKEKEGKKKLTEVQHVIPGNNTSFQAITAAVKETPADNTDYTNTKEDNLETENGIKAHSKKEKETKKTSEANAVSSFSEVNNSNTTAVKENVQSDELVPIKDSAVQAKPVMKEEKNNLPLLTDEEISEQEERKAALLAKWSQLKLDDYSHIHVSSNAGMKFRDFYLKRGEVSNHDYDIFLKDLILQKKANEYETAKPKYEEWISKMKDANLKLFIRDYFTCSQYANYPVVCISPEAAQLYCEWLEAQLINANKNPALGVNVRLPYDDEWKFAARPGRDGKYATDNGKIRSWKKGYKANFRNLQFNAAALLTNESPFVTENLVIREGHLGRKVQKVNFTTTSMAFMMNEFGLYNMSGNVSEIVLYRRPDKNRKMRTIGGNWNSEAKFLEIQAAEEFNAKIQASPFVGFRPEIIIITKDTSEQ